MPEFQHYALSSECYEILHELMQQGFAAIPEEPILVEPRLERYDHYTAEIAEKLERFSCVLLEGSFTKHPLQFKRRASGTAAGTYYAEQESGPRIRWCLPGLDRTDQPRLTLGSVSYLTNYRDPKTNQWERPSEELKSAYKTIIETFKRHLVRMPSNTGEHVWVGKAAKQEIERGQVCIER